MIFVPPASQLTVSAVSSQELTDQFSPGGRVSLSRDAGPVSAAGLTLRHGIASLLPSAVRSTGAVSVSGSMMSPPMSPAKKTKDTDKPKRPMNGFMLFAKKYRLELIQQHPGKDNRWVREIFFHLSNIFRLRRRR